ncbi:hypothetical protein MAPG_09668 [Magnaporthiopsis poae ATCC 64411]|uniref:Uncharacterized protein n=1 Tax=Magnaporthiopsis poae (strain ATCC 64411 / 73-15) TaxID=644358 RepID=A0A0C4EAJ4_MAGP6|nr:hypothetical protein MAPG_09668 [Magnaporthiopsis poae ATCC 64411]
MTGKVVRLLASRANGRPPLAPPAGATRQARPSTNPAAQGLTCSTCKRGAGAPYSPFLRGAQGAESQARQAAPDFPSAPAAALLPGPPRQRSLTPSGGCSDSSQKIK